MSEQGIHDMHGGWHREFWEQEGRPAFERFMEKKRAESQAGSEPPRQA